MPIFKPLELAFLLFVLTDFIINILVIYFLVKNESRKLEERIDRLSERLQKLTLQVNQVIGHYRI